ncbi:MAG TPA: NAD-dependent epimerase/dehydratase family protein [Gemmatimonadales bacterium]|nr:NAD-dependent epimerase/dehydratase family protein [Gemmatimonadales bacterium]
MILLTGGTGLVGLAILDELKSLGLGCTALVRTAEGAAVVSARGAIPLQGSVEDPAVWARVGGISAVIHAAALLRSHGGWAPFARVNVGGTGLAAARARGLGARFIHISSVAVYGDVSRRPDASVAEEHPWAPLPSGNLYARSKRDAEQVVWSEAARGLAAIVLRPCPVYGPGDRLFVPRLWAAARRGWMPLVGPGDRPVPLVHARSVAQAVGAALRASDGWGRAYNVTGDGAVTARQIVAAAARGAGRGIRTIAVPERLAFGMADAADLARRVLPAGRMPGTVRTGVGYWRGGDPFDSGAAAAALGWAPKVVHAEMIERLIAERAAAE